jgi:hypothetical protein
MSNLRCLLSFLALASILFFNTSASAQTEPKPDFPAQYAATAIGQAGPAAGKTFGLSVYIDGLTSDGEIQELIGILKAKKQDGIVSAMQNMKDMGRVSPTGSVGVGMRVVRIHHNGQGGQHIVLATDRPISFGELYNATRSRDYPIAILTMDIDKDGKGSGTFAPACKVKFNKKNELEIENFSQKPFRLTNVYREK